MPVSFEQIVSIFHHELPVRLRNKDRRTRGGLERFYCRCSLAQPLGMPILAQLAQTRVDAFCTVFIHQFRMELQHSVQRPAHTTPPVRLSAAGPEVFV
jgi:hypothetical protein